MSVLGVPLSSEPLWIMCKTVKILTDSRYFTNQISKAFDVCLTIYSICTIYLFNGVWGCSEIILSMTSLFDIYVTK